MLGGAVTCVYNDVTGTISNAASTDPVVFEGYNCCPCVCVRFFCLLFFCYFFFERGCTKQNKANAI